MSVILFHSEIYGILVHQQPVLARIGFLSFYDLFFGSSIKIENNNINSNNFCFFFQISLLL